MSDIDLERYQDSAQGRASVRGRSNDENLITQQMYDDYDRTADLEDQRLREAAHRQWLKGQIQVCMTQMEAICPPVQRSAK